MLKIGSAVHTAHGPGTVTEAETTRGRTQYKVAGRGFSVWVDETKIAASQAAEMTEEAGHRYLEWESQWHDRKDDDHDDGERKKAALGDVDESNSTTLPYDYTPQHPVDLYAEEQTITPDHEIDYDERMTPTNSVTGESEGERQEPGPSPDLFAKSAGSAFHSPEEEAQAQAMWDEFNYELCSECGQDADRHIMGRDPIGNLHFYCMDHGREASIRTARPGSLNHYIQWAQQAGLQPDQDATADLYGQTHGVDGYGLLNRLTSQRGARTAAGGWGDVDVSGAEPKQNIRLDQERGFAGPRGSYKHYLNYANQNGLHPGDGLTADRYSREHGIPKANADDYAMQFGTGRSASIHEAYPGKHRMPPEPEMILDNGSEVWDSEDWAKAHPEEVYADPREQQRYEQWRKRLPKDRELGDRGLNIYEPIYDDTLIEPESEEKIPVGEILKRELINASRPAGLSDKYIDLPPITAAHGDPVAQFCNDPMGTIERTAYLVESATGLDPRVGQYMDLVEADPMIREAAWQDVREKAMRLRREGRVHVYAADTNAIYANVDGDNGNYDVMILTGAAYTNGGFSKKKHAIANWKCDCEWGKWAFKRKITFVGRLCSHGYATYMEQQAVSRSKKRRHSSIHEAFDYLDPHKGVIHYPDDSWQAKNLVSAEDSIVGKSDEEVAAIMDRHNREMEEWKDQMGVHSAQDALEWIKKHPSTRHDPDQAYACRCPKCRARNPRLGTSEDFKTRSERSYDVKGYDAGGSELRTQEDPDRLEPDFYEVPEPAKPTSIDVEKDTRKTTGPDQIMAGRHTGSSEWRPIPRRGKVEKNWAKNHNELDDEHDPIVHFSMRKQALTYTADEGLLTKLRDLSAEPASENYGNMAERNREVAEVVQELRDRGYDASLFVAMQKTAGDGDEKKNKGLLSPGGPLNGGTWGDWLNGFGGIANGIGDFFTNLSSGPGGGMPRGKEEESTMPNLVDEGVNAGGALGVGYTPSGEPIDNAKTVSQTQSAPAASPSGDGGQKGGGGWVSPPGGTKGPVSDGGRPGAENGNNSAITGDSYIVQQGDTLTDIAQRGFGDMNRYEDLARINNIPNADKLNVGQEIKSGDNPFTGNSGIPGNVTNPGGSTSVQSGPALNPAPAPAAAEPAAADSTSGAPAPDPGVGGGTGFLSPPAPNPAAPIQAVSRRLYAEEDDENKFNPNGYPVPAGAPKPGEKGFAALTPQPKPSAQQQQQPAAAKPAAPAASPVPASTPQITTENFNKAEPSDGSKKLEDREPRNAFPTDGMGAMNSVMPILEGVGSAVLPMVTNLAQPIVTGIGNAIGNLFHASADEDGLLGADGDHLDRPFAGSGPSAKDSYGTSEDYVDEYERPHFIDITDEPEGDMVSYRTQPKQAGREESDFEMIQREYEQDRMRHPDRAVYDDDAENSHREASYDDSDIVRQFQANIGNTALGSNGGGGAYSDDAIAAQAQGFLRTAGRVYSLAEQQELMDEEHPQGARNLPGLDLRGTHYLEG